MAIQHFKLNEHEPMKLFHFIHENQMKMIISKFDKFPKEHFRNH